MLAPLTPDGRTAEPGKILLLVPFPTGGGAKPSLTPISTASGPTREAAGFRRAAITGARPVTRPLGRDAAPVEAGARRLLG